MDLKNKARLFPHKRSTNSPYPLTLKTRKKLLNPSIGLVNSRFVLLPTWKFDEPNLFEVHSQHSSSWPRSRCHSLSIFQLEFHLRFDGDHGISTQKSRWWPYLLKSLLLDCRTPPVRRLGVSLTDFFFFLFSNLGRYYTIQFETGPESIQYEPK